MTSDNDKKAAEEYAPTDFDNDNYGKGCCYCQENQESHQEAFLAGCEYKEKQVRAEVIAEARDMIMSYSEAYNASDTSDSFVDCNNILTALSKLERGA